ncbi:hypothetical protein KY304_00145 [Candidatus Woesearchaeota archaeon]|nr:hypothetical protein [Candidatus Woesearchaeota archaeon]MBW2978506.1 hypothetical protein [Candidatus Woesearchaeota archaeon]
MATIKFDDRRIIAKCLGSMVASQIHEDLATKIQPEILAAKSTRYNGKTITELKEIINDNEIEILEDAKKYYRGSLALMARTYCKEILSNDQLSKRKKADLTLYLSKIKGLHSYQKQHKVGILDEFAKIESKQTK